MFIQHCKKNIRFPQFVFHQKRLRFLCLFTIELAGKTTPSLSRQWGLPFLGLGQRSGFMIRFRVRLSDKQRVFSRRLGRIKGLLVVVFLHIVVEDVWPGSPMSWTPDSFFGFVLVIAVVLLVVLEIFFCLFPYVPEGGALAGLSGSRSLGQDIPNVRALFILWDDFIVCQCFKAICATIDEGFCLKL